MPRGAALPQTRLRIETPLFAELAVAWSAEFAAHLAFAAEVAFVDHAADATGVGVGHLPRSVFEPESHLGISHDRPDQA